MRIKISIFYFSGYSSSSREVRPGVQERIMEAGSEEELSKNDAYCIVLYG